MVIPLSHKWGLWGLGGAVWGGRVFGLLTLTLSITRRKILENGAEVAAALLGYRFLIDGGAPGFSVPLPHTPPSPAALPDQLNTHHGQIPLF